MNTQLTILVTKNYGNIVYYPNCQQSKLIADIANTKTLTHRTIKQCIALGFTIKFTAHNAELADQFAVEQGFKTN